MTPREKAVVEALRNLLDDTENLASGGDHLISVQRARAALAIYDAPAAEQEQPEPRNVCLQFVECFHGVGLCTWPDSAVCHDCRHGRVAHGIFPPEPVAVEPAEHEPHCATHCLDCDDQILDHQQDRQHDCDCKLAEPPSAALITDHEFRPAYHGPSQTPDRGECHECGQPAASHARRG